MKNCLVTKLKGAVDNSNLNYLGYIKINFPSEETPTVANRHLYMSLNENTSIKVLNGTFVLNDLVTPIGTDINIQNGGGYDIYVGNTDATVLIPKYKIAYLLCSSSGYCLDGQPILDSTFLNFGQNLISFQARVDTDIDLNEAIFSNNLASFNVREINHHVIYGSLGKFAQMPALTDLRLLNEAKMTGDISELTSNTSLRDFTVEGPINEITGSIEELANGQAHGAAPRTSGTLHIYCRGILYNGSPITECNITFNSSLPEGYSVNVIQ